MPKAKIFRFCACACACLVWSMQGFAQSPPVIGQIIEQAKKKKLNEWAPAPAPAPAPEKLELPATLHGKKPLPMNVPLAPDLAPALWSVSGLNDSLVAEVLIQEQVHRIKVARGVDLPGGWSVVAGDVDSLTLRNGKRVITLFAPELGGTGSQFQGLKKSKPPEADAISGVRAAMNAEEQQFPNRRNDGPVQLVINNEQARHAASALPAKP